MNKSSKKVENEKMKNKLNDEIDVENIEIANLIKKDSEDIPKISTDINVIKSPYYYLQPNDYIYVKPLKQKTWGTGKTGIESLGTIITLLSLATTTFLLLKK